MSRPRLRTTLLVVAATLSPVALLCATSASALQHVPGVSIPATLPSVASVGGLRVENSFVSHVGWVKPGESYPSRIVIHNSSANDSGAVRITIPTTKGMSWTKATSGFGTVTLSKGVVTWDLGVVPGTGNRALVLVAAAKTLAQEPTEVWRNISSVASVKVGSATARLASRGPKVIPASGGFETARYGDRPFPVVTVDYADAKHTRPASKLDSVINSATNKASTFSLYQEMSYGQLYPHGTIASNIVKDATYSSDPAPLTFSTMDPTKVNTCTGLTLVDTDGHPLPNYTKRVTDGWYELPGTRSYYGQDGFGSALIGAEAGVAALQSIDTGCGPTSKSAYDAAVVSDPDIDFNDYDTDKDGIVDFFEVIFQGCDGAGHSQTDPAGCDGVYDNIWPHSSSLEGTYTDPKTGLGGYTTHDQLKDLEGRPLWYTDTTYSKNTTQNMGKDLIEYVRVGPYNVNPETAIDFASVISHEYGHSLGLPDYYSTGSRGTYGDFTLMATDHSQNMDIIGKKELGWVVPDVLQKGVTKVKGWRDTKRDTGAIHWVTPAGKPYTLSAAGGDYGIHNGQAYTASLPGRQLLDPALVKANGGTGALYSGSVNDTGCAPLAARNLDIVVPGLDKLAPGTAVSLSFRSMFEIEWDYDYGFVMAGKPDAKHIVQYTSLASDKSYTTPGLLNPNQAQCQTKYGNGLTGSSSSFTAGTSTADRVAGNYGTPTFVDDSYDLSSLAGVKGGVLRFSYATDGALAKLGWIIDNLKVTSGGKTLYSSGFEKTDDPALYPGGCRESLTVSSGICTQGFNVVKAGAPATSEHGYLLEMRDRSGFDFNGRGQDDRSPLAFQPGVLLTYTDESHGYGNAGVDDPPAQSPLDAKPVANDDSPDLSDATFTPARSDYSDSKRTPHVDNYTEPAEGNKATGSTKPWTFAYDCLKLHVDALDGDTANATEAYDLVGNVTFTTAGGCARFNYGFAAESAVAPAIGGPGLPTTAPPTTPVAATPGLAATGGLGAPVLAVLVLLGAGLLVRRRSLA